jgi:alcohol dehydrogenase
MNTFRLIGHDNPYGSYPSPVAPVGYIENKLAVILVSKNGTIFQFIDDDSIFIKHSRLITNRLTDYEPQKHRLFAFDKNNIVMYEISKEQGFISDLLIDNDFSTNKPFMRWSLAKSTKATETIYSEFIRTVKYLYNNYPDFVSTWYDNVVGNLTNVYGLNLPSKWQALFYEINTPQNQENISKLPVLSRAYYYFIIPTISILGVADIGSYRLAGKQAKKLGFKNTLLVIDAGTVIMGVSVIIALCLKAEGIDCVLYSRAEPNPTDINVRDGVKVWKDNCCDSMISLGGGSSHSCGKGIGLMISNPGKDIRDFEGLDKSSNDFIPYIAINTINGDVSSLTRFCLITNTDTHAKMAIFDWRATPQVCIIDPALMLRKPTGLTAVNGMDALANAVGAYVSTIANPITDAFSIKAIKLIAKSLRRVVALGSDRQARDDITWAEFLASIAFVNTAGGYIHMIPQHLVGLYSMPFGICGAIFHREFAQFFMNAAHERFADIANAMGVRTEQLSTLEAAQAAIDAIKKLFSDVGVSTSMTTEILLKTMAENARKDLFNLMNPRKVTLDDIVETNKNVS